MTRMIAIAVIGAFAVTATALAQGSGSGAHMPQKDPQMHKGSGAGSPAGHTVKGDTGPSSMAFQAANERMHRDMTIVYSGNADIDFVKGMIPHHQGAIDMAKVVLAHGKNAEIRKLAEDVIKAQQGEIAMMTEWLKKNAK